MSHRWRPARRDIEIGERSTTRRVALLLAGFAALAGPAVTGRAQGVPASAPARPLGADSADRLTMSQVERIALDSNPGLRVALLDVAVAGADTVTAALRPNPLLIVTGDVFGNTGFTPQPSANQWGLSLQLPLELGAKRERRTAAAFATLSTSRLLLVDSARRVLLTSRQAFYDVQSAQQGLALAERNVALYARLVTLDQSRFEQKQISGAELSRAVLARAQAELARDGAELQLLKSEDVLGLALGLRRRVAARDTLMVIPHADVTLASLEAQALRARPDVMAARALRSSADANARLQDANATISPSVNLDYTSQQGQASYGVSGSIPIAVFSRNQGERDKAKVRQDQSDRARHAVELAALTEVRSAWTEYGTRRLALDRFTTGGAEGILARAQAVLESTEFAYKGGSLSLLEYLDAVRTFAEITRAYVDAVSAYDKAAAALDAASGADTQRLLRLAPGVRP